MNTRNGTDLDAANAMKVFSNLGYKVKVHNDQTVGQMKQLLISGEPEVEPDPYRSSPSWLPSLHGRVTRFLFFQPQRRITAAAPLSSVSC